jgi:transcriptional regulator with XRE-family HTH domain
MELSQRLKSLRKSTKSPLRAVAARCQCSFQYLSKLEKGSEIRPQIELLYRLAAYYQFPSDILIIEARKVPQDVYYKIVDYPELLEIVRRFRSAGHV